MFHLVPTSCGIISFGGFHRLHQHGWNFEPHADSRPEIPGYMAGFCQIMSEETHICEGDRPWCPQGSDAFTSFL